MTQVLNSIPWVRCASGNVLETHFHWKWKHRGEIFLHFLETHFHRKWKHRDEIFLPFSGNAGKASKLSLTIFFRYTFIGIERWSLRSLSIFCYTQKQLHYYWEVGGRINWPPKAACQSWWRPCRWWSWLRWATWPTSTDPSSYFDWNLPSVS